MKQHDSVRLRHMLDAARQAVEFARGRRRGDLDRDPMLALAAVPMIARICCEGSARA